MCTCGWPSATSRCGRLPSAAAATDLSLLEDLRDWTRVTQHAIQNTAKGRLSHVAVRIPQRREPSGHGAEETQLDRAAARPVTGR